ncbi:S41 family peptidase [Algihabitans albus]|uniref:S41 family peptidase n=1 Tax=Algihabitans albus TaxID=2164067 RepID=UPI000E5D536B|nr:S41 family peptidase [Algihabitans albus]
MRFAKTAVAAAICAAVLLPTGAKAQNGDDEEIFRQLKVFADVFERVRAEYVEEVSDETLIEAAIQGMLSDLDPHSSYLDADSFNDMQVQTRGEFGGLGIEVTMENGLVRVVSPIDDTPAFRAGVEAGDLITHLDGEPVMGLELSEAVDMMRGPVGTSLTITVRRGEEEPFDISIERDIITVQSVRSRQEGNIGYVRVTAFNEQTTSGVEEAIAEFEEELGENFGGIVLDLRNNPGGLLDQAVSVSDAFLERGEIVSTRGRYEEDSSRYNARSGDLVDGLPIVVLINGGSASASEIVAGALQDHRRAIVMGTKSFGKGSVQTVMPLGSAGAMRLTTARYYTPSGRSIQAKGIDPDILVERARLETIDGPAGRSEADLRGSLEAEEAPVEESGPQAENAPQDQALEDYQLARALDLLRGLVLYSQRTVN